MLSLLLLCTVSCSQSGSKPGPFRPMEFQVDANLLWSHAQAGNLDLQVPMGWNKADSALLASVRASLANDTSRFRFEVVGMHMDPRNGAMLLMKSFNSESRKSFPDWAREYTNEYRAMRPGRDIREEWMLIRDLPVVQLFMSDSSRVQFSLLCDSKPWMGLDYVVPRSVYEANVRAVESSIGSIYRMKAQ